MAKKRKRRGHFCWCCERTLPNEIFSGAGHAWHLCRECSKLPKAELDYRQEVSNMLRLVTWEGIIWRKKRRAFARYLEHSDLRIRKMAEELAAEDVRARRFQRWFHAPDEDDGYEAFEDPDGPLPESLPLPGQRVASANADPYDDEDIPF